MLKPAIMLAAASLAVACATTPAEPPKPKTPAELLIGTWQCVATDQGVRVEGPNTFTADGMSSMQATLTIEAGPQGKIVVTGTNQSSWKFLADDKIEETILSFKLQTATMGGAPLPTATLEPMIHETMMSEPRSVSDIEITASTLKMTDGEGFVTSCTRQAAA